MKKESSFFVPMDPPKSYTDRIKERQEQAAAAMAQETDRSYAQSLQWKELLTEEPAPVQEVKTDLRAKYGLTRRPGTSRRGGSRGKGRGEALSSQPPAEQTDSSFAAAQADSSLSAAQSDSSSGILEEFTAGTSFENEPKRGSGTAAVDSDVDSGSDFVSGSGAAAAASGVDSGSDFVSGSGAASADPDFVSDSARASTAPGSARASTAPEKKNLLGKLQSVLTPELRKTLLIIRLAAASLMFAAALLSGSLSSVTIPLLLFSGLLAGADLVVHAAQCLVSGIILSPSFLVLLSFVISFLLGFRQESVAMVILYQVGSLLVAVIRDNVSHNAIRLVDFHETHIRDLLNGVFKTEGVDYINAESVMRHSVSQVLVAMIVFAALFAVVFPLITYYRTTVAIHRAAVVLLLCTPDSVLAAMSVTGRTGLCAAASLGTVFRNASLLEELSGCKTLIFDKSFLFSSSESSVEQVRSDRLDDTTFTNFVYHLVFPSEQSFAKTIINAYEYSYDPSLVSDFQEDSGGVSGKINGMQVFFGTRSYLIKNGIDTSASDSDAQLRNQIGDRDNTIVSYSLYLDGRYGGELLLSTGAFEDISDLMHEFRIDGINKCILISGESAEEVAAYAEFNGFDEVYAGIENENRQALMDELTASVSGSGRSLIITSDPDVCPCDSAVTVLTGEELCNADAVTQQHLFAGLAGLLSVSRRMTQVATENAVIAFVVKAVLIFMSLTGYCNLWMAVLGEMAASVFTIFNTRRISSRSFINMFLNK